MGKKILKLAKIVEPCQRNWDKSFSLSTEHIEYIVQTATTMPTKKNLNSYNLFCITKKEIIRGIYEKAYDINEGNMMLNQPQIDANLLLIWTYSDSKENDYDRNTNIGISAGAASLAAAELGYKTGFCKCFAHDEVKKLLDTIYDIALALGIGKPDHRFDRTVIVQNNQKVGRRISKGPKNISVRYID